MCIRDRKRMVEPASSEVFFFPSEENAEKIIKLLLSTKRSLKVCVYKIFHDGLIETFGKLRERGVEVLVITESKTCTEEKRRKILGTGASLKVQNSDQRKLHHKFAVIDDDVLLCGSLNWSPGPMKKNYDLSLIHI
eukprot:TRINITY_DN3297_c0_g1_i1.p1 TRINITY_DN3297_c0_g1~~TRINITY_DN3297_c0_g1_i1.p1  ORF type:complete len:155 (-),score=42.05 TRINITY_DN3297_c0_g1_i1:59-466(-)